MDTIDFSPYLRLIQKTGTTRHPGGLPATDLLLKRAPITKKSKVLDVGCGAGHTSAHLAKTWGCHVTGVDISREALVRFESFYKNEPFFSRMHFDVADAQSLSYPDNSFDLVLCESVLFFISDKEKALKEMTRVLKPGGFFLLNELCVSNGGHAHDIVTYFQRPEFRGFITTANELTRSLRKGYQFIIEDEQPLDLKGHMYAEIQYWLRPKGILQALELLHLVCVDKETRYDFLEVVKLSLERPKDLLNHLNRLMVLVRKNEEDT